MITYLTEIIEIPRYAEISGVICAFYTLYYCLKLILDISSKKRILYLDNFTGSYHQTKCPSVSLEIKKT